MSVLSDLKVLYHLVAKPIRGHDHAARMEAFYAGQAGQYDAFRRRLLQGRERLYGAIDCPQDAVWVDLGGGTGANLEYMGEKLGRCRNVYVVDLAGSLLKVARDRAARNGWSHVAAVEADATQYQPPHDAVDVVTFSYSLTMIPDWFAAIENAARMLRPGGQIGVVDFYVSRKYPAAGMSRHRWLTRTGWPTWFGLDNVFPSPDHLPFLRRHFEPIMCEESRAKVPYLPLVRTPYYLFIGRKRGMNMESQ